jgi:tetratricopeptide (TPR) repeat protein
MSKGRSDPRKAKQRRDRIRREKHAERATARPEPEFESIPPLRRPFAAERSMREIGSLLEGQEFGSTEELNERLAKLTADGQISEMANAWNRDDPKWRAQELAYDALEADDPLEALRLVNEALELDPDCTDAERLMISLLPMERENRIKLMRELVAKAERLFGDEYFKENAGRFWGVSSTRPYMRSKQYLGDLLVASGALDEAIGVFERMLDLNPGDNQGVRYSLLGLYLATSRLEGARSLLAQYPDEHKFSAVAAWAVVLERWLAGELNEAEAALKGARQVNRFVEPYVLGKRQQASDTPDFYRPGDESEAVVCAAEMGVAWEKHPGFRKWLQALG